MVLISAHRCGAAGRPEYENSRAGLERATEIGAEYVEFDVQRCGDGTLVVVHDDTVPVGGRSVRIDALTLGELRRHTAEVVLYEDALRILAGHKRAHIDLKFTSPPALYARPELTYEAQAAQLARSILGDDGFLVTSLEDRSVRAVRDWADSQGASAPIGLSLGRGLSETPWFRWPLVRGSELRPAHRVAGTHANLVVAHRNIARLGVARWAARHDLPVLVWTVDDPSTMRRWLASPDVWLLTTNYPEVACGIRDELAGPTVVPLRG